MMHRDYVTPIGLSSGFLFLASATLAGFCRETKLSQFGPVEWVTILMFVGGIITAGIFVSMVIHYMKGDAP